MSEPRHVVVVGGSAAGLSAADALRRFGFAGSITVLDADVLAPYDRPPLSKQVLDGSWPPERAQLFPPERLTRIGMDYVGGVRALTVDADRRQLTTDSAGTIDYDELVVATGVAPRRIRGDSLVGVHVLRTLDDALSLRSALLAAGELIVVGAGFIGLEAAASARRMGVRVTVVDPDPKPGSRALGDRMARRLLDRHRARQVALHLGVGVAGLTSSRGAVTGVDLTDGRHVPGRTVLVAVGCRPQTGWLEGNGLELTDGLGCDSYCRAAPGIWGAGDVARWHDVRTGRSLRVEHRQHAAEHGTAVARNIMGHGVDFTPAPYFWTDQFEVRLQVAGRLADASLTPVEGTLAGDTFVAHAVDGGRVVGAVAWNAAKSFTRHRAAIDATRARETAH